MGVRKSIGRLSLAGALAAVVCTLVSVPATAHHPSRDSSSLEELSLKELFLKEKAIFQAGLAEDPPLTGIGENMEIVANVPLAPGKVPGGANDEDYEGSPNASDIELAGDHAYIGSYTQGMVIVNIASCQDPSRPDLCKPFVEGVYPCSGGQFDIQLSPDANFAVVAHEAEDPEKACHPNEEGAAIIDTSDKKNPREIAFISDSVNGGNENSDVVNRGAHNTTLDWPYLYIDQYQPDYGESGGDQGKAEIFTLADPSNPVKVGEITFDGQHGEIGFHDSIPDHRSDKTLLYGASIAKSDIVDVTDPENPDELQTLLDQQVGISHGAEPNHKRDLLIVTDEYGGGEPTNACGGNPDPEIPLPPVIINQGVGAVHFYNLNEEGLVPGVLPNGQVTPSSKAGIFNIVLQPNEPEQVAAGAGCTSHVFWQAPDQNRMTIAWYGRGTRIVDFEDPANSKQLGFFVPEGGNTWSSKPHCGYIFTGDIVRGLDVLRYTGESGGSWPTTSGKADPQRAAVQGTAAPETGPCRRASSSSAGGGGAPDYSVPRRRCSNAPGRAGRRNVGRIRLGQRRSRVRRIMGSSGRYRRLVDRWCLRGGGALRVAYSRRNRVVLILSSSRRTSLARIRRGAGARSLRGRVGGLTAMRVGRNVWFTRPRGGATQVFKVQRGRVREVGLANRRLTSTRRKVRRFFRAVR